MSTNPREFSSDQLSDGVPQNNSGLDGPGSAEQFWKTSEPTPIEGDSPKTIETPWGVREQSSSSESLAAREQVESGAEVSRLVERQDQLTDGAQFWAIKPADSITSPDEHNASYGIANVPSDTKDLSVPGVISGEWNQSGDFITAPTIAAYGSSDVLPTQELVAESGAIRTTGYHDLSSPPTLADVMPPEVRELGTNPDASAPPHDSVASPVTTPIESPPESSSAKPAETPDTNRAQ